uniref:Phospholipase A2 n=1 Tax=Panagrellus redivivus TaxID=6233 RepID=A0A7E4VZD9_PANRE
MNRRCIVALMLLAATLVHGSAAEEYHCGMGTITKALSRSSAYFCDSSLLTNKCCLPHDDCYGEVGKPWTTMTHAICDIKFKHCINHHYRGSYFCRSWLIATHYSPLTVSSFFRRHF